MGFPTNYIKKRDTLHNDKAQPAALAQIGRDFFAAERYSDALDFFEKAKDARTGCARLKNWRCRLGIRFCFRGWIATTAT